MYGGKSSGQGNLLYTGSHSPLLTRIGMSKLHFPGTSCLLLRGTKLSKQILNSLTVLWTQRQLQLELETESHCKQMLPSLSMKILLCMCCGWRMGTTERLTGSALNA